MLAVVAFCRARRRRRRRRLLSRTAAEALNPRREGLGDVGDVEAIARERCAHFTPRSRARANSTVAHDAESALKDARRASTREDAREDGVFSRSED